MPAVTFAGIGSGMDIEGLIEGLVSVSRQPVSLVASKAASARSAITSLSDVGSLLSKLNSSVSALDTLEEVGSYKATSSNDSALAISASGNAQPGSYKVEVVQLAQAERRYSNAVSGANTALGHTGKLNLQIGTGDTQSPEGGLLVGAATAAIDIKASDTLNSVIEKINSSGLRVKASAFFDGNEYRLQVRGLDAGAENALTVVEDGFELGLNSEGNTVQQAQNAKVKIDDFLVESKTNQISQAIPGVTLALKAKTTTPFEVNVAADPDSLVTKIQSFVDNYNAVVKKVQQTAGHGEVKASNPLLAGDSSLRRVNSELSRAVTTSFGEGASSSIASLGIKLNNDGTLKLDRATLDKVVANDPDAINRVLSGTDGNDGAMDRLRLLTKSLTDPTSGVLAIRGDGLSARAKSLDDQVKREEARLTAMEERLRKTFTQMDSTVAGYNAQLQSLYR
jgi:flagellar hook-associated protein 2